MKTWDEFKAWFATEVQSRWADVDLSKKQMADWFGGLSRFDVEPLSIAVSEHYIEDAPKQPSLKKIAARAGQSLSSEPMEMRVVILECVAHGQYKVGAKIRVNVAGRKITDERLADKMTELVGKFENTYRGKWRAMAV